MLGTQAVGQMVGIRTRLDALYFTLSTTATVGYGDIHPTGQLARAVASGHILFNVLLLGAVARLVTARAAGGRVRRGGRPER
ncbi:Na+/H+-dicarboxylate symporter [Phycicoccus sp. 3266]|nr:Na+/H+-dicarboxylate symporter [Phycicoccus sp. 3266]